LIECVWELCRVLIEEEGYEAPTRDSIIAAIRWLVEGQRAGDRLFFAFAGVLRCRLFYPMPVSVSEPIAG
jgi:hypothetical protein